MCCSALESPTPTIRASPSLYEGAFRLETASSPGTLFHPSLMFGTGRDAAPGHRDQTKPEHERDGIAVDGCDSAADSPMSSPVPGPGDMADSYKIRLPAPGSLSPRSRMSDHEVTSSLLNPSSSLTLELSTNFDKSFHNIW